MSTEKELLFEPISEIDQPEIARLALEAIYCVYTVKRLMSLISLERYLYFSHNALGDQAAETVNRLINFPTSYLKNEDEKLILTASGIWLIEDTMYDETVDQPEIARKLLKRQGFFAQAIKD